MELKDVKTLQEVAREYKISYNTLHDRLVLKSRNMVEGVDFRRLGKRQPTLLSARGIEKLTMYIK